MNEEVRERELTMSPSDFIKLANEFRKRLEASGDPMSDDEALGRSASSQLFETDQDFIEGDSMKISSKLLDDSIQFLKSIGYNTRVINEVQFGIKISGEFDFISLRPFNSVLDSFEEKVRLLHAIGLDEDDLVTGRYIFVNDSEIESAKTFILASGYRFESAPSPGGSIIEYIVRHNKRKGRIGHDIIGTLHKRGNIEIIIKPEKAISLAARFAESMGTSIGSDDASGMSHTGTILEGSVLESIHPDHDLDFEESLRSKPLTSTEFKKMSRVLGALGIKCFIPEDDRNFIKVSNVGGIINPDQFDSNYLIELFKRNGIPLIATYNSTKFVLVPSERDYKRLCDDMSRDFKLDLSHNGKYYVIHQDRNYVATIYEPSKEDVARLSDRQFRILYNYLKWDKDLSDDEVDGLTNTRDLLESVPSFSEWGNKSNEMTEELFMEIAGTLSLFGYTVKADGDEYLITGKGIQAIDVYSSSGSTWANELYIDNLLGEANVPIIKYKSSVRDVGRLLLFKEDVSTIKETIDSSPGIGYAEHIIHNKSAYTITLKTNEKTYNLAYVWPDVKYKIALDSSNLILMYNVLIKEHGSPGRDESHGKFYSDPILEWVPSFNRWAGSIIQD